MDLEKTDRLQGLPHDQCAAVAHHYWTAACDLLERSGYTIEVRHDLSEWVRYLASKRDAPIVNPSFDPDWCQLDATNSLWIDIRDSHGRRCAVAADRLIVGDFVEAFAAGEVHQASPSASARIEVLPSVPRGLMTGRIGHSGGLYVERHARKQGFPWLASPLLRALSILAFDVDRQCGAVFWGLERAGFVAKAYRFPDCWLAVDGWFAPLQKPARVFIIHMDRRAMIDQMAEDAAMILANREKPLVEVATIISSTRG